jgi:phage terminase large subunit-like protein
MQSLLNEIANAASYLKTNKILTYRPYPFQVDCHNAGADFQYRFLLAGQQIGKTVANLLETSYHLTGLYPDWWKGIRFDHAIEMWLGGQSTKKVRDNLQKKLLGDHDDPSSIGTGWIPRELIGKTTRMAGIPGSLDAVKVMHVTGGWSDLGFKTYEQKVEEWMGETKDFIALDEEPGQEIFSQCVIRTLRKKGPILITATPEQGMTEVVSMFMRDKKPGTWYAHAAMDDAPHYTPEGIDLALSIIPEREREMRRKGLPVFGTGPVFDATDEQIKCEPFPIPSHYHRIGAIDFGHDHPFASVHCAWDKENDVFYVYSLYTERGAIPLIHAAAINKHEKWIPIAWPHDGLNTEKGSGTSLAQIYRDNGVNLLSERFTNPPGEGQEEGQGGNKIWPGLIEMNQAMLTGKFKVFSNLSDWFIEKAGYHCDKKGDLVKKGEDLMSATRYAYMSRRHAITKPVIHEYSQPIYSAWA